MTQGTQTEALQQPRGVEWGGRWEGGSRRRGLMYTYGSFMLMFGRNQQNSVKQLSFNWKKKKCLYLPNKVLWTSSMAFCFVLPSLINSSILLNRLVKFLPKTSWASVLCWSTAFLWSSLQWRPNTSLVVSSTVSSNYMWFLKISVNKMDMTKAI